MGLDELALLIEYSNLSLNGKPILLDEADRAKIRGVIVGARELTNAGK